MTVARNGINHGFRRGDEGSIPSARATRPAPLTHVTGRFFRLRIQPYKTKGCTMPEVEMRHQISGARDGQLWPAKGGRVDVSDDEAEQLVRTGAAKLVEDASAPDSETAAAPDTGLTKATAGTVETATA